MSNEFIDDPLLGFFFEIVGLGYLNEAGQQPLVPQRVDLNVIDHNVCNEDYLGIISLEQVCLGDAFNPTSGKGACYLDDGGPTVLAGTDDLVAMYINGRGCPNNLDSSQYGIFLELAYYYDWIKSVTGL